MSMRNKIMCLVALASVCVLASCVTELDTRGKTYSNQIGANAKYLGTLKSGTITIFLYESLIDETNATLFVVVESPSGFYSLNGGKTIDLDIQYSNAVSYKTSLSLGQIKPYADKMVEVASCQIAHFIANGLAEALNHRKVTLTFHFELFDQFFIHEESLGFAGGNSGPMPGR